MCLRGRQSLCLSKVAARCANNTLTPCAKFISPSPSAKTRNPLRKPRCMCGGSFYPGALETRDTTGPPQRGSSRGLPCSLQVLYQLPGKGLPLNSGHSSQYMHFLVGAKAAAENERGRVGLVQWRQQARSLGFPDICSYSFREHLLQRPRHSACFLWLPSFFRRAGLWCTTCGHLSSHLWWTPKNLFIPPFFTHLTFHVPGTKYYATLKLKLNTWKRPAKKPWHKHRGYKKFMGGLKCTRPDETRQRQVDGWRREWFASDGTVALNSAEAKTNWDQKGGA